MMNYQNIGHLNKKSDEFTSYFSAIPQVLEDGTLMAKEKGRKTYSLKSLTKDSLKKTASNSKK